MGKRWLPLESNPCVLNSFTSKLGLDVSQYSFHDVFGLDEVCLTLHASITKHSCTEHQCHKLQHFYCD